MKEEIYRDQIIEMYKKTRSGGTIAKELGITNYRVYKCLRQEGFDIKPRGPEKHSFQTMKKMYESGMSLGIIAKKLNMNEVSIWERLRNGGVKIRSHVEAMELNGHAKIKRSDHPTVIQMYQDGKSAMEIAKHFGLKYKDTVLKILHDNKIEIRDMYGENNHAWKGGVTSIHKLIRNSEFYNEFRQIVLVERNHICEITSREDLPLNIHHKKQFRDLVEEFVTLYGIDINDRDLFYQRMEDFEPFWDKNNILVVSEVVHKAIHRGVDLNKEDYNTLIDKLQKKYGSNQCQKCGKKFEPEVILTSRGKRKSTAKYCNSCRGSRKDNIGNKTKAEFLLHRKNKKSFRTGVLENMKDVYRRSDREYKCLFCDFPIVDVCHIKKVDDFADTALMSEINSINNIICLCPLHMAVLKRNMLDEPQLQKIKDHQSTPQP